MNQNPCPICEQLHADVVCPRNKTMTTEQWVPALDVYQSAGEMRKAQRRGGRFADRPDLSMLKLHYVFCDALRNYVYLLGTDPQEPANKHTAKPAEQPAPDRMAYLIDCARQVLDGKTLQWRDDPTSDRQDDLDLCSALRSLAIACVDDGFEVRIKPEPVVSAPIYFELNSEGMPQGFVYSLTDRDTHKLTITNDDGKLSATIEELRKC